MFFRDNLRLVQTWEEFFGDADAVVESASELDFEKECVCTGGEHSKSLFALVQDIASMLPVLELA